MAYIYNVSIEGELEAADQLLDFLVSQPTCDRSNFDTVRDDVHQLRAAYLQRPSDLEDNIRRRAADLGIKVTGIDLQLELSFHGRVIDQLGIQMYQSPVAAVAEMVSNSWDADSKAVHIFLPNNLDPNSEIRIEDDGNGMTLEEVEERYLNAGYDRREGNPSARTERYNRPVLGRKGIGKFAGFGIATLVEVETVSIKTGERTVFVMDLDRIRGDGSEYVGGYIPIDVTSYDGPSETRKDDHGTIVHLKRLAIDRRPSPSQFPRSMSRRFLLQQRVENFQVFVDGNPIPESRDLAKVEFSFPEDYRDGEVPEGLQFENGWGVETLPDGHEIRWQFDFYKDTIGEEELSGVSIFASGKLAQKPFLFNQTGGLYAQAGVEYLAGRVEADYLDRFEEDVIATERQRINWELASTRSLEKWGQQRIKQLLRIWQKRRTEEKERKLEDRLDPFGQRLEALPKYEREIVKSALKKLAGVSRIAESRFEEIGSAILTAWEGGRLKSLIYNLGTVDELDEVQALDILIEAKALTALHTAEAVKAKLDTIRGLRKRIEERDLENAIRDYISENPWLLSPEWDTFEVERSVSNIVEQAVDEAKLDSTDDWKKRMDLVLSSGDTLLVVEFMRPDLTVDHNHLNRFAAYVYALRDNVESNTGSRFNRVIGLLVADRLNKNGVTKKTLEALRNQSMDAMDWKTLLSEAESQWEDFLDVLVERAPDPRIEQVRQGYKEDGKAEEVAATDGDGAPKAIQAEPAAPTEEAEE